MTQNITVNVTNINAVAPAFTSSATFSAAENQTAIGTVTATDAEGDAVTFTVTGHELAITSAGVLTFVSSPDYETKSSYTAIVTATDGVNTTTQNITVTVTNENDIAPVFTSSNTFSAAENQTAIGSVTATDADGDSITFTVSGSELAITSAGVLTFASAPDYETKSSYTATVTASDGTNSVNQNINVNITNVVETAMCAKDYSGVDYSKLPSLASSRYQKAFLRNDEVGYGEYKTALESGEAKVNAGAVYPYDIIKSMNYGGDKVVNNAQWESLPNFMEGSEERVLPVVDVSGSMETHNEI